MIPLLGNEEIPAPGYVGQMTLRRSAGQGAGLAVRRVGATMIFLNRGMITRWSRPAS